MSGTGVPLDHDPAIVDVIASTFIGFDMSRKELDDEGRQDGELESLTRCIIPEKGLKAGLMLNSAKRNYALRRNRQDAHMAEAEYNQNKVRGIVEGNAQNRYHLTSVFGSPSRPLQRPPPPDQHKIIA